MLFNSLEYLFFLPSVVLLYYILPFKYRWILLLFASYIFYAYWKVEYLVLILFSTIIDYYAGYKLDKETTTNRRLYLYLSLFVNLGLLFFFKYYNFFVSQFTLHFQSNEYTPRLVHHLLLPVGISFYTFQTMSYTIDVYNKKLKHEKHLGIFALYVVFFPQLVAGPIERAGHLIKQFKLRSQITYSNFHFGLIRILWGLFKKVVIADRLSFMVNEVYNDVHSYGAIQHMIATVLFAFQIYCDFSGYSDIAIGSARILGIRLMENFKRPYLADSFGNFWHRWHISLSTWFKDYLYIPLGGNRVVKWRWYYNLFITFLISGLWHGANWTFVIWGGLHGILLIIENLPSKKHSSLLKKYIPRLIRISYIFIIVLISWVFFRANNIDDAFYIIKKLPEISFNLASVYHGQILYLGQPLWRFTGSIFLIVFLVIIDVLIEKNKFSETKFIKYPIYKRWSIYLLLIFSILIFGVFELNEFIYFQF